MLDFEMLTQSRILVVDDNASNLLLMERLLEYSGYVQVRSVSDPTQVAEMAKDWSPDLVILDLHMPKMNGFQVMAQLREGQSAEEFLPILVFTADVTSDAKRQALEAGAADFLTKPGDATEIRLRVQNFLKMRFMHRRLCDQNRSLEERVRERTAELENMHLEVVERLARAAEYRDDDTGQHAKRVGEMAAQIGAQLGMEADEVETLRLAATLHDLGKIGVSDSILLKPGKLTEEEFETIKTHTVIGAEVLAGSACRFLKTAETIARSHHERWDGRGYPDGLAGEAIPLEGRIVAVADVYDALTSERPYKVTMSHEAAVEEISRSAGSHFDPAVVQAFLKVAAEADALASAA